MDIGTALVIQEQIKNTVEHFEPRIDNLRVEVDPRPDDNAFNCDVFFDIVGLDLPTQNFTFLLEATR